MGPAGATDAVVEDATRRRNDHTCVRRHGNEDGDDDSECGDHRDDGDVALGMKTLRRDALRRRRGKGGGRGASIADTADDYDCEDRYRRRRTPHRISLNPRETGIILATAASLSITRHTTRRGAPPGHSTRTGPSHPGVA